MREVSAGVGRAGGWPRADAGCSIPGWVIDLSLAPDAGCSRYPSNTGTTASIQYPF